MDLIVLTLLIHLIHRIGHIIQVDEDFSCFLKKKVIYLLGLKVFVMKNLLIRIFTLSLVMSTLVFFNSAVGTIKKSFPIKQNYKNSSNLVLIHAKAFAANNLLAQHVSHSSHDSHSSHASHSNHGSHDSHSSHYSVSVG